MSLEDNKTIIRRFFEESVTQGNFDVFDTSFAPHFVFHLYAAPTHTHASLKKLLQQFHQAVSGHSFTIHDLIAEGDKVAVRGSYAATTHHGHFGKNPPTGQPIQLEATYFFYFEQGKVSEGWGYYQGASFDLSSV